MCGRRERKQAGRSRIHTLCEKRYYGRKRKCCAAGREVGQIERAISDQSGRAVFQTDLPPGTYAVKETKAPDGYYRSDTERIFDFEPYKDQDHIFIIRMKSEIENAAVKVRLFLRDDLTKKELAGAKLQILDEDGKILHAVSTENTEGKGCVSHPGAESGKKRTASWKFFREKAIKREILIPDSMKDILKQEQKQEVTFSVSQQYTEKTMEQMPEEVVFNLENAFMTGKVKISKTGEILNEVSRKLGIVQGLWNQIKTRSWLSNRKRKRCKLYSKSEGRSVSPGWRDRSDLQSGRGCSVSGTKSEDCESRRRY